MKKGFTLVEIMVVVIIMGILAAVGVPKLFGLIAKARASEVPVAAGTYISLQNAYLHENNGIGSWKNIGYGAPGNGRTDYFEYSGCINGTIPFASMEPDMPGWQASNLSGLNSCKTGGAWAVVIDPSGERTIEYRQIVSSEDCIALTSSWGVVGKTVEGMCATTGELHVAEAVDTPEETPEPLATPEEVPEETPASVAASSPSSSPSEVSSSSKQGDCDALAASMKGKGADKGNKYGWVCVSACGMFAPPGKARNAGFDTGTLQKKKDTGGTCEKVEPESSTGGSENQDSGSTTNGEGSQTQQGSGSTGGTPAGDGTTDTDENVEKNDETVDLSGYKGSGEPHEFNPENDVCLKNNETDASKCDEWDDKEGYEGCKGEACPHKYDGNTDYCVTVKSGGGCQEWKAKSEYPNNPNWAGYGEPHDFKKDDDCCLGTLSSNGKTCTGQYRPWNECEGTKVHVTGNKYTCSKWKTAP